MITRFHVVFSQGYDIRDFIEREAQLLCPEDEVNTLQFSGVVQAVSAFRAIWPHEPEIFVVPECFRWNASGAGCLADLYCHRTHSLIMHYTEC